MITISVDVSSFLRFKKSIDNKLDDLKPLLEGFGNVVRDRSRILFHSQEWEESKASERRSQKGTALISGAGGKSTLLDSLDLYNSIINKNDNNTINVLTRDSITVGTKVESDKGFPYPFYHQNGLGKEIKRPFLVIEVDDIEKFKKMTIQYLFGKKNAQS